LRFQHFSYFLSFDSTNNIRAAGVILLFLTAITICALNHPTLQFVQSAAKIPQFQLIGLISEKQ